MTDANVNEVKKAAEEWAKQCIHSRGNPHWHDLRDAYIQGATFAANASEQQARRDAARIQQWVTEAKARGDDNDRLRAENVNLNRALNRVLLDAIPCELSEGERQYYFTQSTMDRIQALRGKA